MKKKIVFGIILTSFIGFMASMGLQRAAADTGEKVLVTLDYFNDEIEKLKQDMDRKIKDMKDEVSSGGSGSEEGFRVVELEAGKKLIAEGGTELILRGGIATAVFEGADGLNDITSGKDLKKEEQVQYNHLLIVPRSNRGIAAKTKAYVMVRGKYVVE